MSVAYEITGPHDAPRVVLTHGAFVDRSEYDAQAAHLAGRYRVLRWDLPEHGRSPGVFRFHAAVDALSALLDQLGWDRAAFVGHSLGGNIAQQLVLRSPERVSGLFAFDCTCNTLPLMPHEYALLGLSPLYAASMPYSTIVEQTVAGGGTTQRTRDFLRDALSRVPQDRYVRIVREALAAIEPMPWYRTPVPLEIAIGRFDFVAGIAFVAPRWAMRDAGSRFSVLENAGHCSNIDAPQAFNALLDRFLAAHAA